MSPRQPGKVRAMVGHPGVAWERQGVEVMLWYRSDRQPAWASAWLDKNSTPAEDADPDPLTDQSAGPYVEAATAREALEACMRPDRFWPAAPDGTADAVEPLLATAKAQGYPA